MFYSNLRGLKLCLYCFILNYLSQTRNSKWSLQSYQSFFYKFILFEYFSVKIPVNLEFSLYQYLMKPLKKSCFGVLHLLFFFLLISFINAYLFQNWATQFDLSGTVASYKRVHGTNTIEEEKMYLLFLYRFAVDQFQSMLYSS